MVPLGAVDETWDSTLNLGSAERVVGSACRTWVSCGDTAMVGTAWLWAIMEVSRTYRWGKCILRAVGRLLGLHPQFRGKKLSDSACQFSFPVEGCSSGGTAWLLGPHHIETYTAREKKMGH
ncbi:hypothetical protein AVEN_27914-1 [Araneus ventricosus]|uniref:Uncharacterized protein n=1 Tax=Araneus ventricosus TaxID=182803 RepID=A0A4Y2HM36_ARAVE|nr:hypothetical protein AVEN_27914-1 [Araneus ventricosus]